MPYILVVRHGETQLNAANKVRGWTDVPLNSKGIQEALATAKLLEGWEMSGIMASDLIRTRQTAQIIGKHNFVSISYTEFLRSWNSGREMAGMDVEKAVPIMRYYVAHPGETPEGGESFGAFLRRVRVAWMEAVQRVHRQPGKSVCIVTSSRDIDAFRFFVTGDKRFLDKDSAVTPGAVAVFKLDGSKITEVEFTPQPQAEDTTSPQDSKEN